MNLIEALAAPGDEPDAIDERMHRDLARRGLTLESWAAELEARAEEVLDGGSPRAPRAGAQDRGRGRPRPLRRRGRDGRRRRDGTAPDGAPDGVDVQASLVPKATQPDATQPDAGRGAPRRR